MLPRKCTPILVRAYTPWTKGLASGGASIPVVRVARRLMNGNQTRSVYPSSPAVSCQQCASARRTLKPMPMETRPKLACNTAAISDERGNPAVGGFRPKRLPGSRTRPAGVRTAGGRQPRGGGGAPNAANVILLPYIGTTLVEGRNLLAGRASCGSVFPRRASWLSLLEGGSLVRRCLRKIRCMFWVRREAGLARTDEIGVG